MSVAVIKQLCRRIERRLGGGKYAAPLAGVTAGVWSNYVSEDHPDTTIPMHRLLMVANAEELALFGEVMTGQFAGAEADLPTEAAELVEGAAALMAVIRRAGRDKVYSETEKRRIRAMAIELLPELQDIIKAVES